MLDTLGGQQVQSRWLGKTNYAEALAVQESLFNSTENYLLLQEHHHVYTVGVRGSDNFVVPVADLGAPVVQVRRGGDVTYHGPGQLVGYPILNLGNNVSSQSYVHNIEQLLSAVFAELGVETFTDDQHPGVWTAKDGEPAKIAAIGVRVSRGRSMHGFAINVNPEFEWFNKIVPCGIADRAVTSLAALGVDATIEQVTDLVERNASRFLLPGATLVTNNEVHSTAVVDLAPFTKGEGPGEAIKPQKSEKATDGVSVRLQSRLSSAGVNGGLSINERKPDWMKVKFNTSAKFVELKQTSKDLGLATVCQEAGCPNIYECWNEGTATFMLLGERCTRKCGFCEVDTRKPEAVDLDEPVKVAETVAGLDLDFAVLTMVARDDLADGGAAIVAETVRQIHAKSPGIGVEVLISDLAGSEEALNTVLESNLEVLNHNVETVPRLQRAVRPSASYLRSLSVLARSKQRGFTTKSGIILGMGETMDEVKLTLQDLAAIGVDIVTIGQYLRPTTNHLPIVRWVEPSEFDELKVYGEEVLGIRHIEASPLTRSSHHAGSVWKSLEGDSAALNQHAESLASM